MPDIGNIMNILYEIGRERKEHPVNGSYTNYLLDKGRDKILNKFGEEAIELIVAAKGGDRDDMIHEAADVMYHMNILLFECGLTWEDVAAELEARRQDSH